uniref:Uncharacterized protein n=1 Tax=Anguilla anguilla TaxID=7936 RepID=A0A0E9WEC2_ANGAN
MAGSNNFSCTVLLDITFSHFLRYPLSNLAATVASNCESYTLLLFFFPESGAWRLTLLLAAIFSTCCYLIQVLRLGPALNVYKKKKEKGGFMNKQLVQGKVFKACHKMQYISSM